MTIEKTSLSEILAGHEIDSITFNNIIRDWTIGQIQYDPDNLTVIMDSGISGVRLQAGQEEWYLVFNDSGSVISNGKFVFASGVSETYSCLTAAIADYSNFFTSAQVLGAATHEIGVGELGLVTTRGVVRNFDTSAVNASGVAWLSSSGLMQSETPRYPYRRIALGTVIASHATTGSMVVAINRISRNDISKSYSFTSQGIGAGLYYKAGFYDFSDTSFAATQASSTIAYGDLDRARDAHAGIVPQAPGIVVGTGQVGLRVVGIKDSENGIPQVAGEIGIITEDITTLTADTYFETSEKWSGQITFELYIVTGSPTAYSMNFNYGFAKYDDLQDRDYTITAFECVWQGNASNNTLDIALVKHTAEGWTFATSNFIAGNGDICRKSIDMQLSSNVNNNLDGAYKRTNLNTYIAGESGEGHIIEITTGGTSTIQTMDLHVEGVSEELDF